MKKLFRVIYPFFIYNIIGILVLQGVFFLYLMLSETSGIMNPGQTAADKLDMQLVYLTAAAAVLSFLIMFPFYRKDCVLRGRMPERIITKAEGLWKILILGAAVCIFGNNLVTLSGIDKLSAGYEAVSDTLYSIPLTAQLLCLGLCIPMGEEMVFRILGFRRLRDDMGFLPAALISAFLFGLYHGNLVQAVYASVLGFIIALAYEYHDSFAVPILIHISANIFSVVITALPRWVGTPSVGIMVLETLFTLGIIIVILRKMKRSREESISGGMPC